MPQTFTRGATNIPAGTWLWEIDGLPNNSEGFTLTLTPGASWLAASGPLFAFDVEIALDGVTYRPWFHVERPGGPVRDRQGNDVPMILQATWPGENDGSGGRRKLRAARLRVVLTALQPFDCTAIDLRPI
jgi:hypothetical protein